ncbi:MAG: nuclear transport factor 2 family protein [Alphaproteobacteria bacterium]|nr:nuclear transport factor 2 family protein [Alphaproteobacteria bacterium]
MPLTGRHVEEDPKLTKALHEFYAAFNDRDIGRLMALFERQAVYIAGSGHHAHGREEIRAALLSALQKETRIIQGARTTIMSGDIALMMSNWSQIPPEGNADPISGTSNIVFRRQANEEWLIVIDNPVGIDLIENSTGFSAKDKS